MMCTSLLVIYCVAGMLHSRGHTCHEISWAEFKGVKCTDPPPPLPTPTHLPNTPQVDQSDILHLFSCCTTGICFTRTWFYSIETCRHFLTVALILDKQFFGFCKYSHIARGVMKCRPPNLILIFVCNQLNRHIGLSTTALRPISII